VSSDDPLADPERTAAAAARAGARIRRLEGLGHWWLVEDPARGAAVLQEFWDSVG
jgi:hypothetical protein